MTAHFWVAVGQIILIDILLGGDNAVVIALACRSLPPEQRRKGIIWGTAGAIILRVILIAFALALLAVPYLKLVGAILLMTAIVKSPFGHALQAARDNEKRALSLGFPVFRLRLVAFVVSAMIAGLAGYLSAAQFGFVAPQMLGWHLSATVLVMVVLGGMSSVLGPVIGAFALIGLEEILKSSFEHWKLIKGLIIIAIVFALPGGIRQLAELVLPRRGDEGPPAAVTPADGTPDPAIRRAEAPGTNPQAQTRGEFQHV